jgi:hypothetical protein
MTPGLLQDVIVTAIAFGAGAIVVRRVFGFVTIKDQPKGGCDKCAAAPSARVAVDGRPNVSGGGTVHPVILVRPGRR